jgi:serine/threonine-protein kinase
MVFHRDIKPANLIRQPDGRIFLVDFGAARDAGATAGATLVGTFGYMPVEQLGGLVDATSDLYALGATLLHLLSRREPWSVLQEPEPLKRLNVTPEFRRFLRRLLAPRSQDRFPSAATAAEALRALDRPASWRHTWLPLPRVMAAGLGAVMLVGLLMFGVRVTTRVEPVPPAPVRSQQPVMVAPNVGRGQLAIDPNDPRYRPTLPPEARRPGMVYWGLLKVCADSDGTVVRTSVIKAFNHPGLDETVQDTVRRWRYRPYLINGVPTPFCTPVRIELRGREGND